MNNNTEKLEKLQQRNNSRMERSPHRVRVMIDIGVEHIESEQDKEDLKDEVLSKYKPHSRTFFMRGAILQIRDSIVNIRQRKLRSKHHSSVMEFVSESFQAGINYGLTGIVSKGKIHVAG